MVVSYRNLYIFSGLLDYAGLGLYIVYQLAFLVMPINYIIEHNLPPASAVIVTTEQVLIVYTYYI